MKQFKVIQLIDKKLPPKKEIRKLIIELGSYLDKHPSINNDILCEAYVEYLRTLPDVKVVR